MPRASAAGLASLIPQRSPSQAGSIDIPIGRIQPNPFQPRKRFDPESLATLAASISEHGVIQPILVTEILDGYQLVAGERRLRAAEMAGLERVPAVVRQLADRDQLELALVENLQRADLDAIETAIGIQAAHRRVRVHPGRSRRRASGAPGRPSRIRSDSSTSRRRSRPRSPMAG